jgi:hypothetical protein
VVLPQKIDRTLKERIIGQGARLPYHFTEAGGLRYVMMSKEKMREEGLKSPDLIDAMSFAFLESCHYSVADRSITTHAGQARKVANDMAAELAAELADV